MLHGEGKKASSENICFGALELNGLLIRRGIGHVYLILKMLLQSLAVVTK